MIRLFLDDYEDTDGRQRLESALASIQSNFSEADQKAILDKLIGLGIHLNEEGKEKLCFSISKIYPRELERLAEQLDLIYLLDDSISKKVQRLKLLNQKLYEEYEQIGAV